MKASAPRTFSTVGKISRKSLVVTTALAAVSGLAFAVVASTNAAEAPGAGVDAARQLLAATRSWQAEHGEGCPTISELVEDGRLGEKDRVEDSFGNRFRIICDGARPVVRSAGPDHKAGTKDDLSIADEG
ncbi:MAG TPA: hypothetical protein VHE30_11390 [Polyangiaceae bacterium]|nr:hypothetical protein [Polyangiaceae bacterium]